MKHFTQSFIYDNSQGLARNGLPRSSCFIQAQESWGWVGDGGVKLAGKNRNQRACRQKEHYTPGGQ